MCFITLITATISMFVFTSQSASTLPVRDSHQRSNELSKILTDTGAAGDGNVALGRNFQYSGTYSGAGSADTD
jgi:hypothetical protein